MVFLNQLVISDVKCLFLFSLLYDVARMPGICPVSGEVENFEWNLKLSKSHLISIIL